MTSSPRPAGRRTTHRRSRNSVAIAAPTDPARCGRRSVQSGARPDERTSAAAEVREVDALLLEVRDAGGGEPRRVGVEPGARDHGLRQQDAEPAREVVVAEPRVREVAGGCARRTRDDGLGRAQVPEQLQGGRDLGVRDRVEAVASARHAVDQAGVQEHAEVLARGGGAHPGVRCQLAGGARRAVHEQVQEAGPDGCGQGVPDHREVASHARI